MLGEVWNSIRLWNRKRLETRRELRRGQRRQPHKLGLLAIMKNEAANLPEWLEHYRWQGVDRFYLIDNGSTDGSAELLRPWVEAGIVRLAVLPERHAQERHYRTTLERFRARDEVQWLMVADLDEFWFSTAPGVSIAAALDQFDKYDLIYCNWSVFGSGGHVAHPPSLRRCLVKRHPRLAWHDLTKWICRTDALRSLKKMRMHRVGGICSARTVSDNQTFQLNHYVTQSEWYFKNVKMARGDAYDPLLEGVRTLTYFKEYDAPATHEDRTLAELLAQAEAAGAIPPPPGASR